MAYGGGLPPNMHNPLLLQATADLAKERARKRGLAGMPTMALIVVLPFVLGFRMSRFVYRKATGWTPPPTPGPERMTRAEMRELMDDICSGSGRSFDGDGRPATCETCGREVGVTYGKLLTHSR